MNELIDNILTEWAYRVQDGMPNPKNQYHLVVLEQSMKNMNLPKWFDQKWLLRELRGDKKLITEASTEDTTFYHEFITGAICAGWKPKKLDTGADLIDAFPFCKGTTNGKSLVKNIGSPFYKDKKGVSYFDIKKKPPSAVVDDAIILGSSIIKQLGKCKKPCMWTGPTNDSSDYGASDIAGKFSGNKIKNPGDVGVSLKYGAGQLKNLTLGTFTTALGLPSLKGSEFVSTYSTNFDAMTKDWTKLIQTLFEKKTSDKTAISIFKGHLKKDWSSYQSEKISQDDLDILFEAVGMNKQKQSEAKHKTFKYFCRKIQYKFHPQWAEWATIRGKHFDDIFGTYLKQYDIKIRVGLSNLFKKQLSVGEKSIFYAAKKGSTFWFIPSETLYDKYMGPEEFIADYELAESKAGYKFYLDVGTQTVPAVGTVIIEVRFKQGQMEGAPDVSSQYKLVEKDWSSLLGAFRK